MHLLQRLGRKSFAALALPVCLAIISGCGSDKPPPATALGPDPYIRKGPYLMLTPQDTAMTVLWQTQSGMASDATIEWGANASRYGAPQPVTQSGDNQFIYTIKNLKNGARVYYRATVFEASSRTPHAFQGSFLAPPGPNWPYLTFYAYGDTRDAAVVHDDMLRAIMADSSGDPNKRQTLLIHTGDFVHRGLEEKSWDSDFFQNSSRPNTSLFLASMPIMGCVGNHECYTNGPVFHLDASLFRKYWPFEFYTTSGYYYSYDYGPVHFIVLDPYLSAYDPGSAQYAWLEQELSQTSKPWKIVFFHYPPYNAGVAPGAELEVDEGHANKTDVRNYLCPLFEKYGVKLVMNGHQHYYARSEVPLSQDPSKSICYLVLGGGGAELTAPGPVGGTVVVAEASHHFARLEIQGNSLQVTVTRLNDQDQVAGVLDQFSIRQ